MVFQQMQITDDTKTNQTSIFEAGDLGFQARISNIRGGMGGGMPGRICMNFSHRRNSKLGKSYVYM